MAELQLHEEAETRFRKAARAASTSGSIFKFCGLVMAVASPLALVAGPYGLPLTAGLLAGGATTAAIGSSATSNKRAAQMAELNAWLQMNAQQERN